MKIQIAYDGSESADMALEDLKHAGLPSEAEVLVLSLADVFLPDGDDIHIPEAVKHAREHAKQMLAEARVLSRQASERVQAMFPGWHVTHEALADSPAWALLRIADQWKPDLIVMGAQGHSVFGGRLILGSISQRVLYEARCSVRIARARRKKMNPPVRILIGVDQSRDSAAAVDAVCSRHWPNGSEVAVLAVVDTVMAINSDLAEAPATKWIEVGDERNWDQVREIFEPSAEKLRRAGLHTEVLIRRGNPTDQLLEEADTWGADCIFVGARGTRGIDRLLLGSVSSAVSARANCSVEVVR